MIKPKEILSSLEDMGIYDVYVNGETIHVINDYDMPHVQQLIKDTGLNFKVECDEPYSPFWGA